MIQLVKIKRFIKTGNLNIDDQVIDSGDLAIRVAGVLTQNNVKEIIGPVVFEGTDGNFYKVNIKAIVDRVHPSYVDNLEG